MARVDARCRAHIPVAVIMGNSNRFLETKTANISLGGAFLNSNISIPEAEKVCVRAILPNYGEVEIKSRVLRAERSGIAVGFLGMEPEMRSVLWELIKTHLDKETTCPYCGSEKANSSRRCMKCGLSINFSSPEYLDTHEAEKISLWSQRLDASIQELIEHLSEIDRAFIEGTLGHEEKTYLKVEKIVLDGLDAFEEFEKVAGFFPELLKEKRIEFKNRTDHLFRKSYFMNHARVWPKGYPGDYKILENIYRNSPLAEGIGFFLDRYFLARTLAIAVRERLAFMRELLRDEITTRPGLKILNLACGSSREVFELANEIKISGAKITCVDHDGDALAFSVNRLSYSGIADQVAMRKYNVLRMVDHDRNMREFGAQDIIYSMGLYDYLADNVLIRLFNSQYRMLNPGGKAILTFKDSRRYRTPDYHWLVEWAAFYQRTEGESRNLIREAGIPDSAVETLRDPSEVILFYIVGKE